LPHLAVQRQGAGRHSAPPRPWPENCGRGRDPAGFRGPFWFHAAVPEFHGLRRQVRLQGQPHDAAGRRMAPSGKRLSAFGGRCCGANHVHHVTRPYPRSRKQVVPAGRSVQNRIPQGAFDQTARSGDGAQTAVPRGNSSPVRAPARCRQAKAARLAQFQENRGGASIMAAVARVVVGAEAAATGGAAVGRRIEGRKCPPYTAVVVRWSP